MPAELDEIRRRIMQLQIELEALRTEKDPASQQQRGQGGEGVVGIAGEEHAADGPLGE